MRMGFIGWVGVCAFVLCAFSVQAEAAPDDLCADYKQADSELNSTYKQVLAKHSDDKAFLASIKKAQRAWLAFRDAHAASIYPAADKQVEYGSMFSSCNCAALADVTRQRVKQLQQWLSSMEGDVCAGSRM